MPPWSEAPPPEAPDCWPFLFGFIEPRETPPEEANAPAWAWTSGSEWACSAITAWRIFENLGFSWRESGVGGIVELLPRAISGVGGSVGRSERILSPLKDFWFGKTY